MNFIISVSFVTSCFNFLGKQIIHPAQIDVVNNAFAPTKERIDYAERLVKAFDEHQLTGKVKYILQNPVRDNLMVLIFFLQKLTMVWQRTN